VRVSSRVSHFHGNMCQTIRTKEYRLIAEITRTIDFPILSPSCRFGVVAAHLTQEAQDMTKDTIPVQIVTLDYAGNPSNSPLNALFISFLCGFQQ
jgi:hypothetical protein